MSTTVATRVGTVTYEFWVPPELVMRPMVWRGRYAAAIARYGFVEVVPPLLVADGVGSYVARGVVRAN